MYPGLRFPTSRISYRVAFGALTPGLYPIPCSAVAFRGLWCPCARVPDVHTLIAACAIVVPVSAGAGVPVPARAPPSRGSAGVHCEGLPEVGRLGHLPESAGGGLCTCSPPPDPPDPLTHPSPTPHPPLAARNLCGTTHSRCLCEARCPVAPGWPTAPLLSIRLQHIPCPCDSVCACPCVVQVRVGSFKPSLLVVLSLLYSVASNKEDGARAVVAGVLQALVPVLTPEQIKSPVLPALQVPLPRRCRCHLSGAFPS
jgi:hypothetical protein